MVLTEAPVPARSVQGESTAAAPGSATPRSRSATRVAIVRPPPAESPPIAMRCGSRPCGQQPAVRGDRVLDRRRERILGRQPVVDAEHPRAARLVDPLHQVAVRRDRADGVATAVQVEDRALEVGLGTPDPLGAHAVGVDRLRLDVGRQLERRLPLPPSPCGDRPSSRPSEWVGTGARRGCPAAPDSSPSSPPLSRGAACLLPAPRSVVERPQPIAELFGQRRARADHVERGDHRLARGFVAPLLVGARDGEVVLERVTVTAGLELVAGEREAGLEVVGVGRQLLRQCLALAERLRLADELERVEDRLRAGRALAAGLDRARLALRPRRGRPRPWRGERAPGEPRPSRRRRASASSNARFAALALPAAR